MAEMSLEDPSSGAKSVATPTFSLRAGRLGDGKAMADVFRASVRALAGAHYSALQTRAWAGRMSALGLESKLSEVDFVVAEVGGRTVGFGAVNLLTGELEYLYIAPDSARRGIGKKLLAELEARSREKGLKELFLIGSLNGRRFYESAGYRVERGIVRDIDGIEIPCLYMTKSL